MIDSWACPFCNKDFKKEEKLRDHVETKHGIVYGNSHDLISAWYEETPLRLTDLQSSEFKEDGEDGGLSL